MENSIEPLEDCACPYIRKMNEVYKEVNGFSHKVSCKLILNDIIKNIDKRKLTNLITVSFVIGVLMSIVAFFITPFCLECIREFYYSVLPNLLGFSITVYSILFSITDTVRHRLQQNASDDKSPFEVLHATFVLGIVVQGFTLILGMFSYILIQFIPNVIVGGISWILFSFIILWTIHTVLNLYSLRTFENNDNKN